MISSKENDMKEEIYQGYQQLAFGSIADAIKLLFMEEPAPRALGKMNFINVAEIRRMKEGAMEIKFFDRLKALEKLEEITDQGQTDTLPFMRRWKTAPSCCKSGLGRMRLEVPGVFYPAAAGPFLVVQE